MWTSFCFKHQVGVGWAQQLHKRQLVSFISYSSSGNVIIHTLHYIWSQQASKWLHLKHTHTSLSFFPAKDLSFRGNGFDQFHLNKSLTYSSFEHYKLQKKKNTIIDDGKRNQTKRWWVVTKPRERRVHVRVLQTTNPKNQKTDDLDVVVQSPKKRRPLLLFFSFLPSNIAQTMKDNC